MQAWHDKARALDRYRWQLLRAHHSWFGSLLRFAREALADLALGWRARRALPGVVATSGEPCDFLLLQASVKVIPLRRKHLLIEALAQAGYCLKEEALRPLAQVVAQGQLVRPPAPVPLRYFALAAYAQWWVTHYRPRVLLNDRNGSLLVPFLRLALHAQGALLVQLAHASTVEGSRKLSMNDYDYYLLFGRSSLQALRARRLRFGTSQALLSGSHMIDASYSLPPPRVEWRSLLILGVGPDKEKEPGYRRSYALLAQWARRHPEYRVLVKRHPRSQVPFWQQAALPNLEVLPADCSLAEALARASVVINLQSNAVIEAALAGRPVLYVNDGQAQDIFDQAQFFGAAIDDLGQLESRLAELEREYPAALERARAFADFHLAHGAQGLACCVRVLSALQAGQALPDDIQACELAGSR